MAATGPCRRQMTVVDLCLSVIGLCLLSDHAVSLLQLPVGFSVGVKTAMAQFEQLLTNRNFLLMLLEALESQKTFSSRDRWVRRRVPRHLGAVTGAPLTGRRGRGRAAATWAPARPKTGHGPGRVGQPARTSVNRDCGCTGDLTTRAPAAGDAPGSGGGRPEPPPRRTSPPSGLCRRLSPAPAGVQSAGRGVSGRQEPG